MPSPNQLSGASMLCIIVCSMLIWVVSVSACERNWTRKVLIFVCLVFSEEFFVNFKTQSIKKS